MFTQESRSARLYNIKCDVDAEGLLKVTALTGSHVRCKSGNVSEKVQDSDIA